MEISALLDSEELRYLSYKKKAFGAFYFPSGLLEEKGFKVIASPLLPYEYSHDKEALLQASLRDDEVNYLRVDKRLNALKRGCPIPDYRSFDYTYHPFIPLNPKEPRSYSPTQLKRFYGCPYSYYLERILDIEENDMVNPSGIEVPLTMEEGNPFSVWHALASNDESLAAISERVRLFYVALTRAEEKIIIVEEAMKNLEIRRVDATNILKIIYKQDEEGNDKSSASITGAKSFREFLALSGYPLSGEPRPIRVPLAPYQAYQAEKEVALPEFRTIQIPAIPLVHEPTFDHR